MSRSVSRVVFGFSLAASTACADRISSPIQPGPPPIPAAPAIARLVGEVDLTRGTMSFSPAPGERSGPDAADSDANFAIYGDQGLNVRLYNTAVVVQDPSRVGFKTYTANVGVRNLLDRPIGAVQGGATPSDTTGVFVFFTSNPIVTSPSPCAGCTATLLNAQGTGTFDLPNRSYFYWPERLSAVNGGSDTTRARRPFVFEASTGVTNFRFEVLVSAAWPAPYDSLWRVEYQGDSLPDTQSEPKWRWLVPGAGTTVASGGLLTLNAGAGQQNVWFRSDSLTSGMSAFVESRFYRQSGANNASPKGILLIDDNTRFVAIGIGGGQAGFINNTYGAFLGSTFTVGTTAPHTYQLRKFGADSVQMWVDGAPALSRAYAGFDASTANTQPMTIGFGSAPTNGGSTLVYDYVVYQIGRATP